jgi:type I restriction-modification system DNA methylase subunit
MSKIPSEVIGLVDRFKRSRATFESTIYLEASVRQEFIDPFFRSLGWDVGNQNGWADQNKDVVVEPYLDIDGSHKAPDYGFRVGPQIQFFVEAKRPGIVLRTDLASAKQIRTYGWNAGLPVCGLTNFGEFAVFDTTVKPSPSDSASTARVKYINFLEYEDSWDWIESLFGRDSVWRGSLQDFKKNQPTRQGSEPVDVAILGVIEKWRQKLANEISRKNNRLSVSQLNEVVQLTIDRILFLRICEDRDIQPFGDLRGAARAHDIYGELLLLFRRADARYNSGMFHFSNEPARPSHVDDLTPNLSVGNDVLADLIDDLYPPNSPFNFRFIGVEVLGNVYEQFLGKVIRLAANGKIVIEEKPEIKKAGGVVYTPQSVVKYICAATVSASVLEKSAGSVSGRLGGKRAHPLRIIDPACGSGSFLLTVYQELLNWYLQKYCEAPEENMRGRTPVLRPTGEKKWELTTSERKRILLDHIFGVDIDSQAVEVTKLSLLLKCLEGESDTTINQQLTFLHERALPDLENNIRCGNSLIGTDFVLTDPRVTLDRERMSKINMFDWQVEFPSVFQGENPGFDVVLGNPPYVLLQDEFRDDLQLNYFRSHYKVAEYKLDLYHLFLEKSMKLARTGGWMSMITPSNYLANNHLEQLRRLLLQETEVKSLTVIDGSIFPKRSVDCAIILARTKGKTTENVDMLHATASIFGNLEVTSRGSIDPVRVLATKGSLFTGTASSEVNSAFAVMERHGITVGDIARVHFGKQLRNRKIFPKDVVENVPSYDAVPEGYMPCYTGKNVTKWSVEWSGLALFDNEIARMGGCWDASIQNATDKLITRQIGAHPIWGIDVRGFQCLNTVFMVALKDSSYQPLFLLGLLNSSPLRAYWIDRFYDQRATFPKVKGTYLKRLPLPSDVDLKVQNEVIALTSELIRLTSLKLDSDAIVRRQLERGIAGHEDALDKLVGALFGLDEIQISLLSNIGIKTDT